MPARSDHNRRMRRSFVPSLALLATVTGCDPLEEFSLSSDQAFCGKITAASQDRDGFSPSIQMRLKIDLDQLQSESAAGRMTTYDEQNADQPRLFDEASLRALPALMHDPLSRLQFGEGRHENHLFAVTPAEQEAESLLAVISFKVDQTLEVRLLRPGRLPAPDNSKSASGSKPLFGLFSLQRQSGDCGF